MAIISQTNTETVSKAALRKLLTDEAKGIWALTVLICACFLENQQ